MPKIKIELEDRDYDALDFFCNVNLLDVGPAEVVVAFLRGSDAFRKILDFHTRERLANDSEDLLDVLCDY